MAVSYSTTAFGAMSAPCQACAPIDNGFKLNKIYPVMPGPSNQRLLWGSYFTSEKRVQAMINPPWL